MHPLPRPPPLSPAILSPLFTSASTPWLPQPAPVLPCDARGILNPVLQHWWIRFTRKLFPYVSTGRVSSPLYTKSTRGRFSAVRTTDERDATTRLGSIKLFTKILYRASPHGTRYFSYLNRSLVVSRSKYFYPKESSHGRVRMKKRNFPSVWQPAAFVVVAFFRNTYGCFRDSPRLTFCDTYVCYVVNNCRD